MALVVGRSLDFPWLLPGKWDGSWIMDDRMSDKPLGRLLLEGLGEIAWIAVLVALGVLLPLPKTMMHWVRYCSTNDRPMGTTKGRWRPREGINPCPNPLC